MNKYAAEKIAQEYYQIGQALALESLGMTKEANAKSKLLKALGITAGGTAGLTAMHNAEDIAKMLSKSYAGPGTVARSLENFSDKIVNFPGAAAGTIASKAGDAMQYLGDKGDDILRYILNEPALHVPQNAGVLDLAKSTLGNVG